MSDDWFGHRDPRTGEKFGDRDEWISWDHHLVTAYQTIEAYTDRNGNLRWELEDEAVYVDAVPKIDKFEEAKDLITGAKNYKPTPGEYFVAEVKTRRSSGHIQTFPEYLEAQRKKTLEEAGGA